MAERWNANAVAPVGRRFRIERLAYGIGKIMLVAILFFLFFLLAHSMVTHRFFRGGWYNRNGTIQP